MARRACIVCMAPTLDGSRCLLHQLPKAQAYGPEYQAARKVAMQRAGGQCERYVKPGVRCPNPAQHTHHVVPIASARNAWDAVKLARPDNLECVCVPHHKR